MKAAFCVVLLAVGVLGAEEKKTEKRGAFGLGYGLGAPAPLLGGLGLYGHGVGGLGWGHAPAPLLAHGYSAPLVSHGYSAPLVGHAPLLGLGHGIGYGAYGGYGGYGGWH